MTDMTKTTHEDRAERARNAAGRAREELAGLEEQRTLLSVSAFEGDAEARQRLEELDSELSQKRKDLEISERTAGEAGRIASDLRRLDEEDRLLAEEAAKRQAYDELAERRQELEEQAQESLEALLQHLDDLAGLDREQRMAGRRAGVQGVQGRVPWHITTNAWISGWLRPHAPDLDHRPDGKRPLKDLDTMPPRAMTPGEIEALQAANAQEARDRRAAADEARATVERAEAIERRRRELLAATEHAASRPDRRRDIEQQIEHILADEFAGYAARNFFAREPGEEG